MLYELGIPVCSLEEVGFPWSLDVQQKVPVPLSRDVVQPSYLYRLIGSVLEQAALDGHRLLNEDFQSEGFVKAALDWVRDQNALGAAVKQVFGENVVRWSSDPVANAQAAAAGAMIVPGRFFTPETRARMESILPTSKAVYGGTERIASPPNVELRCPN